MTKGSTDSTKNPKAGYLFIDVEATTGGTRGSDTQDFMVGLIIAQSINADLIDVSTNEDNDTYSVTAQSNSPLSEILRWEKKAQSSLRLRANGMANAKFWLVVGGVEYDLDTERMMWISEGCGGYDKGIPVDDVVFLSDNYFDTL